ncbi:MAG: tyrosine-type recombinase/integrase [Methyloceanibacter sp.]
MQAQITNTRVKRLKPADRPYEVNDTRIKGFLVRVQPSGYSAFYVQWGRGKRKCIGRADVLKAEQARTIAKELLGRHYAGKDPREEAQQAKRAMTFAKFVAERFGPWAEGNSRTGRDTAKRLRTAFPDLSAKKLSAITAWDIEKWRGGCAKRGLKAASINRGLAIIRAALNKAVEWKLIASDPVDGVKKAKEDKAPPARFLADAELGRLLLALDEREEEIRFARRQANAWRRLRGHALLLDLRAVAFADHLKAMVLLSLHTGLRRGELFSLTWDSINLEHAMLTVNGATAKSGNTRHIPLNATAAAVLRDWWEQSSANGLVFPSPSGARFDNVRKAWAGVLRRARIQRFRWHDLRHHFASTLVMRGVDLATVRELMGHSDFGLTLRYAHLQPEHRAAAVAKLVGDR